MIKIKNSDIGKFVHILSRQVKRRVDEAVSKYNVTAVQCSFIEYIFFKSKENNYIYAKNIEESFNMRRATVAEILRLMEKNGLIERKTINSDARLKAIMLTQKSLYLKNDLEKEIKKVEQELKEGLTDEELEKFAQILEKMSINLNKKNTL